MDDSLESMRSKREFILPNEFPSIFLSRHACRYCPMDGDGMSSITLLLACGQAHDAAAEVMIRCTCFA